MQLNRHTVTLGLWGLFCSLAIHDFWLSILTAVCGGLAYSIVFAKDDDL